MEGGGSFEKIISDIKSIKIQGATDIALAGIKAYLKCPTISCSKKILSTRPTEPLLQNVIKILTKTKDPNKVGKLLLKKINDDQRLLARAGARLIKDGMNIFTHCHSSSVIGVLKEAKRQKKKFIVYTIEVEPFLQGRMTARELSSLKINTVIGPDLAAEQLLKQCDLFLFGADAFTKHKIANKIGTATLCRLAKMHNLPRYSCGVAMKYTKVVKFEKRAGREVWKDNKKNIEVIYPAFDSTPGKWVTGVVSELGVLSWREFVRQSKNELNKFNLLF